MKKLDHNSISQGFPAARGIVVAETNSVEPATRNNVDLGSTDEVKGSRRRRRCDGTSLSVGPEAAFPDAAMRGLIDDWLVPMLVNRFIESRLEKVSQENESK